MATIKLQDGKAVLKDGKIGCECCSCIGKSGLDPSRHLVLPRSVAKNFYENATTLTLEANISWVGIAQFLEQPTDIFYNVVDTQTVNLSKDSLAKLYCEIRSGSGRLNGTITSGENSAALIIPFYCLFFVSGIYSGSNFVSAPRAQKLNNQPNSDLIINTQFNFDTRTIYGNLIGGTLDSSSANLIPSGYSSLDTTMDFNVLGNSRKLPLRINYESAGTPVKNISAEFNLTIS